VSAHLDDMWPMIEDAVFRLFDELMTTSDAGEHIAIGPRLEEMGWAAIESEYPIDACELLFRAQGRSLANTDCLSRAMLAELGATLEGQADGIVLLDPTNGEAPATAGDTFSGVVLGPARGRLAVPVHNATGSTSISIVDADRLAGERLDTFDNTSYWTRVSGDIAGPVIEASDAWNRAITTAYRALATELLELTQQALRIAVEHNRVRVQFGSPIGSFQSPRHRLAAVAASTEGARALVDEAWQSGEMLTAQIAKAAAGRAHREVSDAALQVCGAIGLTAEHDLHRYVTRGYQVDSLCGSYQQLETQLGEHLFGISPRESLPQIVTLG
jgi:hypothetical protein